LDFFNYNGLAPIPSLDDTLEKQIITLIKARYGLKPDEQDEQDEQEEKETNGTEEEKMTII